MNHRHAWLLTLLLLCACSESGRPTATTSPEPAPAAAAPAPANAMPDIDPIDPATLAAQAPTPRPANAPVADNETTFEFWFSAKTESDDPRVVQWLDDPCGPTPVAVVDRIPLDDPYLMPDFVVEFAADGRELHRWGKPFSAEILTIDGEELLFRSTSEQGAWKDFRTDSSGRITVATDTVESTVTASAQQVDCPALPAFAGSGFVQCYEVADADGRKRLLAWEGACS